MEKEIERFECVGDDGRRHLIVIFQQYTASNPQNRESRWIEAGQRFELIGSTSPLNKIDDDTYKIVITDEIIRRI